MFRLIQWDGAHNHSHVQANGFFPATLLTRKGPVLIIIMNQQDCSDVPQRGCRFMHPPKCEIMWNPQIFFGPANTRRLHIWLIAHTQGTANVMKEKLAIQSNYEHLNIPSNICHLSIKFVVDNDHACENAGLLSVQGPKHPRTRDHRSQWEKDSFLARLLVLVLNSAWVLLRRLSLVTLTLAGVPWLVLVDIVLVLRVVFLGIPASRSHWKQYCSLRMWEWWGHVMLWSFICLIWSLNAFDNGTHWNLPAGEMNQKT